VSAAREPAAVGWSALSKALPVVATRTSGGSWRLCGLRDVEAAASWPQARRSVAGRPV